MRLTVLSPSLIDDRPKENSFPSFGSVLTEIFVGEAFSTFSFEPIIEALRSILKYALYEVFLFIKGFTEISLSLSVSGLFV
jgi:hypothetical protein